jgi:hypothetical protein
MTLVKQITFLFAMLLLGIASLVLHEMGYPFAWKVDQTHWFPVAYVINVIAVFGAIGAMFYAVRRFLFGRGRPYLAIFSIACWLIVWGGNIYSALAGERVSIVTGRLYVGNSAILSKLTELNAQPLMVGEVAQVSETDKVALCIKAILLESGAIDESDISKKFAEAKMQVPAAFKIMRDGLPISVPVLGFDYAKLEKLNLCSATLKTKRDRLLDVTERSKKIVQKPLIAQVTLARHPHAIKRLYASAMKPEGDLLDQAIDSSEFSYRIFTNGQLDEHEWVVLGRTSCCEWFVNPNVWFSSTDEQEKKNTRFAWLRAREKSQYELHLVDFDCRNRKTKTDVVIEIGEQIRLFTGSDEFSNYEAGSIYGDSAKTVCDSKKIIRLD